MTRWVAFWVLLLSAAGAFAQASTDATKTLSMFLGHWEGGGTFSDTKLSKADKVTSTGDCDWSPQHRYLVCEQTIRDSKGTHGQLTVFYPTEKKDEVGYATFQNSAKPVGGTVQIEGNVWTFQDTFTSGEVETTVRTTNRFEGDQESFRVEYSQDRGAHWTTMLDGEQHRVKK